MEKKLSLITCRLSLIAILCAFFIGNASIAGTVNAQPKQQHNPSSPATLHQSTNNDEGVEAFSDTTGWDDSVLQEDSAAVTPETDIDDKLERKIINWLDQFENGTLGVMGSVVVIIVTILMLLVVFAILFLPFIILLLVIRHLIRRHNDRVTLAEKAMESGQPMPEEITSIDKQGDEYLRRSGIRNICIGIGLVIMFMIWDSTMLTGIGALVICYGIGQLLMIRSSKQ